jgi:hypothetical protein
VLGRLCMMALRRMLLVRLLLSHVSSSLVAGISEARALWVRWD